MPPFSDSPGGAIVTVRVTPRAGRTLVSGISPDGQLLVRVAAAPVEGAANDAVVEALSEVLHLPRRHFRIVSGERSRIKRIVVAGCRAADLDGRVAAVLVKS